MKEKLIDTKERMRKGPEGQTGIQGEKRIKKSSIWWDNNWEFSKTIERLEPSNSRRAIKSR